MQSTRAGATYGLALCGLVVVANVLKYPAFSFGPRYAAATGTSLLEGYRQQGRWALVLYGLLTIGVMFTVQAAVALVTAGLAVALLGIEISPILAATILIGICAGLLGIGRYPWLDAIMKVIMAVLTVSTIAATLLVIPRIPWETLSVMPSAETLDKKTIFFVAALIGWMPSAIDISVWHSMWTLAKRQQTKHAPTVREALLDFDIGYLGTVILAFCFIIMGAAVMHNTGARFAPNAAGFANQAIGLYTAALGDWARPIIAVSAFAVMFSTTLTVVDGFPRALSNLAARFQTPEKVGYIDPGQKRVYWASLAVIAVGSIGLLFFMIKSLKGLVDLATTLSFLTAPVLAVLNHRAVLSDAVPAQHRPSQAMVYYSLAGIVGMAGFTAYYLYLRFLN